MAENLYSVLVDGANELELAAADATTLPANTRGFIGVGYDGANTRFIRVDSSGHQYVLSSQLPGALVGGRLDVNLGSWLGSTVPTVGQKTMAQSVPVTISSNQSPLTVNNLVAADLVARVSGRAADGAAPVDNPVLTAGYDGTNVQTKLTDTAGRQRIVGAGPDGSPPVGDPVMLAGWDGTNAETIKTNAAGRVEEVLYDSSGNAVGVVLDGAVRRLQTADKIESWFGSTAPTVGQKAMVESLPVSVANDQSAIPVVITAGTQSYFHGKLVAADVPAQITSGNSEPFDVGGDTFTIDVDAGGDQTSTFSTRVAQAGIHYSGPYPATTNPGDEKLKVSVDGGALQEVKTGKGLTTGAAIAAALQTQIRALVENGSGVTVEYNTAEYPFRYVFKSGTTGASSSMHVEKGGDDLAKDIFVGAFGGTERGGLAADNYWAFEVVGQLGTDITDVFVQEEMGYVVIETVAGGSSASLEVTAGGANTALGFTTSLVNGVTGSGGTDMAVDGSSAPIRFQVVAPTNDVFVVQKLEFFIRDNDVELKKWGSLTELTNGVRIDMKPELAEQVSLYTVTTTADLITQCDSGEVVYDAFAADGKDLIKAVFDFGAGFRIVPGGTSNLYVTIQDDLTGLDGEMYVRARGVLET